MKRRQVNKNVSTGKMPPPVGFKIAPVAQPQIIPGSTSGSSNVSAIRSTFAFLPYNADEVNKRIFAAQQTWQAANRDKSIDEFPGMRDLFGTGNMVAVGSKFQERQRIAKSCANGQVYVESSNQCECPGSTNWCNSLGRCATDCSGSGQGRPGNPYNY
jgi:hypothetical protein